MPHVIRRIKFLFTVFSFAAGVAGVVVFYVELISYLSGSSFATKAIAFVVFTFATASLITGVLSVASLKRRRIEPA